MCAHVLVSLRTAPLLGPFSSIPNGESRRISHGGRMPQCHLWVVVTLGKASRYQRDDRVWKWALIPWWRSRLWHLLRLWDRSLPLCTWTLAGDYFQAHTTVEYGIKLAEDQQTPTVLTLHNSFISSFPEGIEDQNRMWRMAGNDGKDCVV